MKVYKLFRKMKDGYAPLFIDATNRLQIGETQECKTGLVKKGFSPRDGWHGCFKPYAPHLVTTLKTVQKGFGWRLKPVDGWKLMIDQNHREGHGLLVKLLN